MSPPPNRPTPPEGVRVLAPRTRESELAEMRAELEQAHKERDALTARVNEHDDMFRTFELRVRELERLLQRLGLKP